MGEEHKKSMERLTKAMGDFTPHTLKTIYEHHPEMVQKIEQLDKVMVEDGALDRKTRCSGETMTLSRALKKYAFKLASYIRGDTREYKGFVEEW